MKSASNLDTPKNSAEATGNFTKTAQNFFRMVECTIVEETFSFPARHLTTQETKNVKKIK